MRNMLLARGLEPDKVVLMRHWVDREKIAPSSRDNPWRCEQGIGLDKFVVLSAGTIGYISGAEVIVDAAQRLRDRQDILFLIVGEGPIKEKLVEKARQYGLENMKFMPFQSAEALADVQATGNVGLVTLLPATGESSIPSKMHGYTAADDHRQRGRQRSRRTWCAGEFGIVCPPQDVGLGRRHPPRPTTA